MSGIYIHVPFCTTKCNYCNFFSVTTLSRKEAYIKALVSEIEMQRHYLKKPNDIDKPHVDTIYFGGGTPSLLTQNDLNQIFEALSRFYSWSKDTEITFEANPDDVTDLVLQNWRSLGINRLSIGVQSFRPELLKYLTRRHSAEKSASALCQALKAGFSNLSGDLIYGIPGLTDRDLINDAHQLVNSGVNHISAYSLTVEPKTTLDFQIRKGRVATPDDDVAARQFYLLEEILVDKGFEHYEISNYARPGFRSKHNGAYWTGEPYLGLGPSAHSYNGCSRQWNPSLLQTWLDACDSAVAVTEVEVLTPAQVFNELLMTRLRTIDGLSLQLVEKRLGPFFSDYLIKGVQKSVDQGDVVLMDGVLVVAPKKIFLSDAIISELMYVD